MEDRGPADVKAKLFYVHIQKKYSPLKKIKRLCGHTKPLSENRNTLEHDQMAK